MKKRRLVFRLIFWALLLVCIVWLVFFGGRFWIYDIATGIGFEPSAEMRAVSQHLSLTDLAERIFRASRPEVQSAASFNQNCATKTEDSSTLGCYSDGRIYVYDIDHTELTGVKESILAHELLHAAWARLSSWERQALEDEMRQAYEANRAELEEYMELYSDDNFIDELHSRLGTQIDPSKLPAKLREHYAKYFDKPAQVFAYYSQYNASFKALKEESDALYAKIETLRTTLDENRRNYQIALDVLNNDIGIFNGRANSGYYTGNRSGFDTDRAVLVRRQGDLDAQYQALNDLVDEINGYIDQYNANILHANELRQVMNSNAAPNLEPLSD